MKKTNTTSKSVRISAALMRGYLIVRAARIVEKMAGNQVMKAKMELSRYPSTLKAFLQRVI